MTTTEWLKEEIEQKQEGVFAPYYFKYLGYRQSFLEPKPLACANAVYTLFAESGAHIYRNDLIAGSIRTLWKAIDEKELAYAKNVTESYGERDFPHNSDHFSPDYERVVRNGIPGLMSEIECSRTAHAGDEESVVFLDAMKKTLLGLRELIRNYAEEAARLKAEDGYDAKKTRFIRDNCEALLKGAPTNFAQGLQLVWFCHQSFVLEGKAAMALGRMDQYLYPLYLKDWKSGVLDEEFATELLENVFIKIYEHRTLRDIDDVVNICIGGTNTKGECEVNELSYLILKAVGRCNVPGPNLSARVSSETPDEFFDACLQVVGTGLGYPAFMNDEVNIAALLKYGYSFEDACNYSMVGCIENFIPGKQPPWTDGRFDTPRFFEHLFNRGRGIFHPSVGLDTGDVSEISSMDQFMRKFEEQLKYGIAEYIAFFRNENTRLNPREYVQPYLSCFCRDCIGRARDINHGGSLYPSVHGVGLMGIGTVCDSLAAIEKVVFEEHQTTLSEIGEALRHNFEGFAELRHKLLAAPKYGNDDDFVDKYAVWFVEFFSEQFLNFKTHDGGGIYIAMAANINNIFAGRTIAATPDGRLCGEPLSDAASPTYGRDTNGATATVNSVTKPDYTCVACGTVINQKFSPNMFQGEKRKKLLALLKVYFKKGGQEMQINATSREILQDAMKRPEKYRSLVVRVSGFSALYVTLEHDVQQDILQRTQQS